MGNFLHSTTRRPRLRGLRILTSVLGTTAGATLAAGAATAVAASATLTQPTCGDTVTSSVTLSANLNCQSYTAGPALVIVGDHVTLNLNHHNILGPGGSSKTEGVEIGANSSQMPDGDTVENGTIKNFNDDVYVDSASNLNLTSLSLDFNASGDYYGVYVDGDLTGGSFSSITANNAYEGMYLYETSGVAISHVTMTSDDYGIELFDSGPDTVSQATLTDDSEYGFYGEYDTDIAVSDSSANQGGSSASGFEDYYSQDSFVGDTANQDEYGFYVEGDGYGASTLKSNHANDNVDDGFYLYENHVSEDGNFPHEKVIRNVANDNGSDGFYDYYSTNALFQGNQADSNHDYGMNLEYPDGYIVEDNTTNGNTDSGIYFATNYSGYYNVQAANDNIADHNGDYGLYGDYGTPGSGNVATNNTPFNCYSVMCNGMPTVTKLSPNKGAAGIHATIYGTNLLAPSAVHFGSKTAKVVKVFSSTKIEVTVPSGSGTVNVTVTAPGGTSAKTAATRFTY